MQCVDLAHSTYNKTIRLCQCKTGYYYLWETETCVTGEIYFFTEQYTLWALPIPQLFEQDTDRHFFGTNNFTILLHVQVIFQYDLFHTALSLGESCIHSRQCMMKMPYSTCGTDRKCRCQLAFLELNNSCSPGIYYCVSNLFILLPSIIS